jgi:hypothetical protein
MPVDALRALITPFLLLFAVWFVLMVIVQLVREIREIGSKSTVVEQAAKEQVTEEQK